MNTNYAEAYKMAYDYDTMINVVHEHRKQKAIAQEKQKARKKRNRWENVFPNWKGTK